MAICPKCGQNIPDRARFCPECGANIGEALQKQASYVHDTSSYQSQTPPGGNRKGSVAGFVLSLISLVCFLGGLFLLLIRRSYFEAAITIPSFDITKSRSIVTGIVLLGIALVLAIPGLVLSVKGRRNPARRGMGTAGLWISIIVLALTIICDRLLGFYALFGLRKAPEASVASTAYVPAVEEVRDAVEEAADAVEEVVTQEATEAR